MRAVKYVLAALLLSLIALVSYSVIATPETRTAHMSCDEAMSDARSAKAAARYAESVSGRLVDVHDFMVASGFDLRNFLLEGDHIAFVYVLKKELRSPCLLRRAMMIDTTLIIIRATKDLQVLSVDDTHAS